MSVKQTTIPITPVRTLQESFAMETAIRAVERFLSAYFPHEFVVQQRSGAAVVGQWISLMPGREQAHANDIAEFTQDLLMQIQVGKERTLISDALSFFLGGLMPTYTRAKTLAGMLADLRPASEVEAYFHHTGYGSVKAFVEANGSAIKSRALAKCTALTQVLQTEANHLNTEWERENTIVLAQASPAYEPTQIDAPGGGAANDPTFPRPKPELHLVPPAEPAPPAGAGTRILTALRAISWADILIIAAVLSIPGDTPTPESQKKIDEFYKKRDEEKRKQQDKEYQYVKQQQETLAKAKTVGIPLSETKTETMVNTTDNSCQAQTEVNKKNGTQCEDDGYVLMEQNLQYQRLVDPPKGRGLDGLFEKRMPYGQPNPLPAVVQQPKPGKLIFIPEGHKPPGSQYDFTGKPHQNIYPRFVVWEAKHISKTFEQNDTAGMTKAAKGALGRTCDGAQMGTKWTEARIPQALKREHPKNKRKQEDLAYEIEKHGYARWMFLCLPGPIGDSQITKLYVLIDVVVAGMDLDSVPAKLRKQRTSKSSSAEY